MRQSLKIAISLLISIVLFGGFTVFAFSGLFNVIEAGFFYPRVQKEISSRLDSLSEKIRKYHEVNFQRFAARVDKDYVASAFEHNQTLEDISSRVADFGTLQKDLPDLTIVRLLDPQGEMIHFSTLATDIARPTQTGIEYKTLAEADDSIPGTDLVSVDGEHPKLIIDGEHDRFIYSFPVYRETGGVKRYRGSGLFYVSSQDLLTELLRVPQTNVANVLPVKRDGVLLNFPRTDTKLLSDGVDSIWRSHERETSFTVPFILTGADGSAENFMVFTQKREPGGFVSIMVKSSVLEMSRVMKGLLLAVFFFTVFLIVFLLFNLRPDPVEVLTQRIKRFQIQLLEEFMGSQGRAEWEKWRRELEARRGEITHQILRGIGRISSRQKPEIDAYVSKSWDEIIDLLGRRAEVTPSATASPIDISRLESLIQQALKNAQFVTPLQKPVERLEIEDLPVKKASGPFEASSTTAAQMPSSTTAEEEPAEEVLEEVEEAPEAADDAEEVEELEEVPEAEEVEEAEEAIPMEAGLLPATEETPGDDAEEVEEAQEAEEVEEIAEAQEAEEARQTGEIEETESVQEPETEGTLEEAEELEEVEEPEPAAVAAASASQHMSDLIEVRIPSSAIERRASGGLKDAAQLAFDELSLKTSEESLEELEPIAEIIPLPPEPVEEGLELLPVADEKPAELESPLEDWRPMIDRRKDRHKDIENIENNDHETREERERPVEAAKEIGPRGPDQEAVPEALEELEEVLEAFDEARDKGQGAEISLSEAEKREEISKLIASGIIKTIPLERLQSLVDEVKSAIVIEDGVFRIKEEVYSAGEKGKEGKLKDLAEEVIRHEKRDETATEGKEEGALSGIGDLIRDEEAMDLAKVVGTGRESEREETPTLDKEKSWVLHLKRNGIDYDEFLSEYPRSFTHTAQMKSLVEISRRVSAVGAGILMKKVDGYAPDLTIGASEKTIQLFRFPAGDPLTALLDGRKTVSVDRALAEIRSLKMKVDADDLRFMKRLLLLPATFRGQEAYMFFLFSSDTDVSLDSVFSGLKVR